MSVGLSHIRRFAHVHDDVAAFHAGYLVMTLLAAAMLNLGVFGMLIVIHMVLDIVKYREYHEYTWAQTIEGVVRESLVDATLFFVGLVFSIYLHHSTALVGVSGLLRAELTIIQALGTLIPKMKILQNFLKVMSHLHHYLQTVHPHLRKGWNTLDRLCFGFIIVSLILLIFAAPILSVDVSVIKSILAEELIFFRF